MKIRNNSVRVIFIGDAAVVPGKSEVVDDAWEKNPVFTDYIANGDIEVVQAKPKANTKETEKESAKS